jgi:hypothetical protein
MEPIDTRSHRVKPASSTSVARFHLALALVGLVLTWFFNLRYFLSGGSVAPDRFWADAMVNPLTSAITVDVYLSALAFSVWVWRETARVSRWRAVAWIALCFGIGLAVALPLYLARRDSARLGPAPGRS